MMTSEELQAIKERVEKATPGEWFYDSYTVCTDEILGDDGELIETVTLDYADRHGDVHFKEEADAQFVAHARQDVPALISEVERLEKERAALEFHLKVSSCALEIEGAKADKFQRALEKIDDDIGIITSKEISEIVEKALEGTMALGDDDCS